MDTTVSTSGPTFIFTLPKIKTQKGKKKDLRMNSGLEGIELDTLCQRRMIRKNFCSEENLVARCELSKMAGSSLEIKYKR